MKTFDVRIASRARPGEDRPPGFPGVSPPEVRFRVAADSWVEAWHQALFALGEANLPEDASCTVGPARVEIECSSDGRRFLIEPLIETDPRVVSGQPMLFAEGGELVPVRLASEAPRERASRFSTVRGAPLSISRRKLGPPAGRRAEPTPPTTPELARDRDLSLGPSKRGPAEDAGWRQDAADPLARVLSGLERERLLARPVKINPRTGLPTPLEVGVVASAGPSAARPVRESGTSDDPVTAPSRATRHSTRVDSHPPGPASDRRVRIDLPDLSRRSVRDTTVPAVPRLRPGGELLSSVEALRDSGLAASPMLEAQDEASSLPQQYRPVLSELVPPTGAGLLNWAAEVAWQQIPCSLSLCLSGRDSPVVLAARGLRERETVGGRLSRDGSPSQFFRVSHRIRYAEGAWVTIEHPDGGLLELRVDSALCMPVLEGPEPLSLLLLNAPRPSGFTDAEARALSYLARTVAEHHAQASDA